MNRLIAALLSIACANGVPSTDMIERFMAENGILIQAAKAAKKKAAKEAFVNRARENPEMLRLGGFVGDVSVDSPENIELICEAYGRANLAVAGRHVFFFTAESHIFFGAGLQLFLVICVKKKEIDAADHTAQETPRPTAAGRVRGRRVCRLCPEH